MELIDVKRAFPYGWHSTFAGGWERICASDLGLASTTVLLDHYGVVGEQRERLESAPRFASEHIEGEGLPPALIRDQKPSPSGQILLERVLEGGGMTVEEWCLELNRRTYFFVRGGPAEEAAARLRRRRARRPGRRRTQARRPLRAGDHPVCDQHRRDQAAYAKRGRGTFRSIADYPAKPSGAPAKPVAEITVSGAHH